MNKIYKGQSLLAMMIAISLGSLLLLLAVQFFIHLYAQQRHSWLQLELQLEAEQSLQSMANELSRAGFRAPLDPNLKPNWHLFSPDQQILKISQKGSEIAQSCVLFFYDRKKDGCFGHHNKQTSCIKHGQNNSKDLGQDLFAYRLYQQRLERRSYKGIIKENCQGEQCQKIFTESACEGQKSGWTALIDDEIFAVHELKFQRLAPKLIQIKLSLARQQAPKLRYQSSRIVFLANGIEASANERD